MRMGGEGRGGGRGGRAGGGEAWGAGGWWARGCRRGKRDDDDGEGGDKAPQFYVYIRTPDRPPQRLLLVKYDSNHIRAQRVVKNTPG